MHRKLELEALEAELAGITDLLAEAEGLSDPVGLMQYEQRKQELENKIRDLREIDVHQASVTLFFGGKPVIGSRGIAAEFAGKALEIFQELVSKQFAKAERGSLGERGPVPMKANTTLMITGVAQGSFGFVLEELDNQTQIFDTALKENVTEIIGIIESVGSVDDFVFENAAAMLDKRTLIALKDFFINLDSNEATVRLADDARDFLLDEAAVHRARLRTEATEIDENDKIMEGILRGFLPEHRRFELRLGSGVTIYGSATNESTEQFLLTMDSGTPVIGKLCSVKIKERIIRPLNRPPRFVYRLLEFINLGSLAE